MSTHKYDSTVARIAGNIASGLVKHTRAYANRQGTYLGLPAYEAIVEDSVLLARLIVAETLRTEPAQ